MRKSNASAKKRKRKPVIAKHVVVTAPLKIHLPHEFIAKPLEEDYPHRVAREIIASNPEPEILKVEPRPPWWKFWAQ